MEIFWRTIAYYNSATWLLQIVIILIGIALTGLLIGRPRPWVKMAMKFYMIGLYTWISLVYYYIYCEERSYNGVMAMFWGVMAIIWIWDAITGYTTFERTHKYDLLSYVLLAMPFIYPLVSLARAESKIYQLAVDKRLRRTGCVADYYHVFGISSERLIRKHIKYSNQKKRPFKKALIL